MKFPPFRRFQRPEIHRGLGNGFHKRSGLYKIDNFWAFVRIPSFQRSQRPEIHEIQKGLGNGFRKKSGLYKIDNFWAFVRFSPFQRPRGRTSRKSRRALEMACATGAELQNRQLLGFCEVPSISAAPEAGNPGNPQGIWKWLPQKKRPLQNRQLLGFCEVPLHFGGPKGRTRRGRTSRKSRRALEMASATGAELQNRQFLGFCAPEAGNPGNPQGIWKWLPQKKRPLKIDNFWAFVKFPSISAVPKVAQGGLYKIDNFWAFVKFPPFRRSQRPEISPPIELEISAPAACIFHHATCRHFHRCEPTDITGRNLPMMLIPLSLDAHQCVLVACAWRVENAKRRQALTVSWRTPPRSSCDICQPKWRTSWGRTTPLHLSSDVC